MVQRRNNGIKPNQPGETTSGSGFSTRKELALERNEGFLLCRLF